MTILKQPFIEKNIKGRPYITVSAKGIANGLSNIPNDGADFGPDTPGTQTSGIQEALNTNLPIILAPGTYNLYSELVPDEILEIKGLEFGIPPNGSLITPDRGVVLKQNTAGNAIIHVKKPLKSLIIDGISGICATGAHGLWIDAETYLNSNPPQSFGEATMAFGFDLKNIYIYGVDANHYAFWFENIVTGQIGSLYGQGGGFTKFRSYMPSGTPAGSYDFGNIGIYGYWQHQVAISPNVDVMSFDAITNQSGATTAINNIVGAVALDLMVSVPLGGNLIYAQPMSGNTGALSIETFYILVGDLAGGHGNYPINGNSIGIVPVGGDWPSWVTFPNGTLNFNWAGRLILEPGLNNPAIIGTTHGSAISITNSTYFTGGTIAFSGTAGQQFRTNPYAPNTLTLPANPPVSGTVYQNTTGTNIYIYLPVTFAASVASTFTPAVGPSNPPVNLPSETTPSNTTGFTRTYVLRVPAGWYYSFTISGSGSSFGTATVIGE
jgi:hypothetical protein